MASIETRFLVWKSRANDALLGICGVQAAEVWHGDWHFDWHRSWVAGCTPFEAAQDAYCELDGRGLLGQELTQLCENGDLKAAQSLISVFLANVDKEVARATSKYPPFNSAHEGYAVLLEEVDELWSEVKRKQSERDQDALITEALHVAAMATRFAVEIAITNHDK